MAGAGTLGRPFAWLWSSYAVSALGTWLAFDAFALIAILALHTGPAGVSALAATGPTAAAAVAVLLGPWLEHRRRRPVMIAADLIRFACLVSVPAAYALGLLTFAQLAVVAVAVGAADIAFNAASGAYLKTLVGGDDLVAAGGRLESTTWTAAILGPPLGTYAVGVFGPIVTVLANAVSFLLSAAGIHAIGGTEPAPVRTAARPARTRPAELFEGWRHILTHPGLRPLFANTVLVSGLIMATAPLLAMLMLGDLGSRPGSTASPSPCPASAASRDRGSPGRWSPGTGGGG